MRDALLIEIGIVYGPPATWKVVPAGVTMICAGVDGGAAPRPVAGPVTRRIRGRGRRRRRRRRGGRCLGRGRCRWRRCRRRRHSRRRGGARLRAEASAPQSSEPARFQAAAEAPWSARRMSLRRRVRYAKRRLSGRRTRIRGGRRRHPARAGRSFPARGWRFRLRRDQRRRAGEADVRLGADVNRAEILARQLVRRARCAA